MVESEYKCLIDKNVYESVFKYLCIDQNPEIFTQINYYYDTDDFRLHKNDITFRIRQKNENLSIDIKQPIEREGILSVKNELKYPICFVPKSINIENFPFQCNIRVTKPVNLIGELVTERCSFSLDRNIRIDLDKNSYYGILDYELEIEYLEGYKEDALNILKKLITGASQSPAGGKRNRLINRLKEINNYGQYNIML